MDVKHIAKLAHLEMADEDAAIFQSQLEGIVTYIEQLNELDTEGVEQMTGGLTAEGLATDCVRDDVPGGALGQESATGEAPSAVAGHFRVPKVL
jgi:aspartyl-tRNA(Asn)/glutamyl-tRNA(Gln) amidotransferase subunit C